MKHRISWVDEWVQRVNANAVLWTEVLWFSQRKTLRFSVLRYSFEKVVSFFLIKGTDTLWSGREDRARPGFPGNKPNHQASWLLALQNQNCCFRVNTWEELQRQPKKEIPKRTQRVPKATFTVGEGLARKHLPVLPRELGLAGVRIGEPSRKEHCVSTKMASQICHQMWVCPTQSPNILSLVIRVLYTVSVTSLLQLFPHGSLSCPPSGQCTFLPPGPLHMALPPLCLSLIC